jgi:hypothetical protein
LGVGGGLYTLDAGFLSFVRLLPAPLILSYTFFLDKCELSAVVNLFFPFSVVLQRL